MTNNDSNNRHYNRRRSSMGLVTDTLSLSFEYSQNVNSNVNKTTTDVKDEKSLTMGEKIKKMWKNYGKKHNNNNNNNNKNILNLNN